MNTTLTPPMYDADSRSVRRQPLATLMAQSGSRSNKKGAAPDPTPPTQDNPPKDEGGGGSTQGGTKPMDPPTVH